MYDSPKVLLKTKKKYHVLWNILKDILFQKLLQIALGSYCFCILDTYTLAIN